MKCKRKVFILMRYSILSIDAARSWKVGQKQLDDYRNDLFNSERLDLHEYLFLNLTFPSILESLKNSSVDLVFIMFISTELPKDYKEKLYKLSSLHNFFIIKELSPSDKTLLSIDEEVLNNLRIDETETIYATIRLDDDDALHPNFIRSIEKYICPAYINHGFSFSCGYSGMFSESHFKSFHRMNSINSAQGQIFISKIDSKGEVDGFISVYSMKVAHSRLHWSVPVIVDGRNPMYIRTVHAHGDFYSEDYKRRMSSSEEVNNEKVAEEFLIGSKLIDFSK